MGYRRGYKSGQMQHGHGILRNQSSKSAIICKCVCKYEPNRRCGINSRIQRMRVNKSRDNNGKKLYKSFIYRNTYYSSRDIEYKNNDHITVNKIKYKNDASQKS